MSTRPVSHHPADPPIRTDEQEKIASRLTPYLDGSGTPTRPFNVGRWDGPEFYCVRWHPDGLVETVRPDEGRGTKLRGYQRRMS